jgi:hypothetical protein
MGRRGLAFACPSCRRTRGIRTSLTYMQTESRVVQPAIRTRVQVRPHPVELPAPARRCKPTE